MTSFCKLLGVCALLALVPLTQPVTSTQAAQGSAEFSEEKIDAFVNAAIDVAIINTAAKDAFDKAVNRQEQDSIIAAARNEMDTSIENAPGITIEEYIAISATAEANPTFAEMLNQRAMAKFKMLDDAHGNAE
tara:strand:+ start:2904 stop:3302 length:399 start_codon:yes stop_codon:yes gene_type:complete